MPLPRPGARAPAQNDQSHSCWTSGWLWAIAAPREHREEPSAQHVFRPALRGPLDTWSQEARSRLQLGVSPQARCGQWPQSTDVTSRRDEGERGRVLITRHPLSPGCPGAPARGHPCQPSGVTWPIDPVVWHGHCLLAYWTPSCPCFSSLEATCIPYPAPSPLPGMLGSQKSSATRVGMCGPVPRCEAAKDLSVCLQQKVPCSC